MGSPILENGPLGNPGICFWPGSLHPPSRPESEISEEEWADGPQKVRPLRDKVRAELWLSTAGRWGSAGSGVSHPREKRAG